MKHLQPASHLNLIILCRFEDLKSTLPGSALENVHINKVLEKMEPMCEYICQNTEKMSCNRLLAVLGTLRRWEIDHNDVEFSVKVSTCEALMVMCTCASLVVLDVNSFLKLILK